MNKGIKHIVALLICLCITCNSFSSLVVYADENGKTLITLGEYDVITEETKYTQYEVIRCQDDFLFSGEDISSLTGFEYSVNKDKATFTRGAKVITINIKKNILQAPGSVSAVKLENQVVSEDGIFYYSGAQLFPWLNIKCFEQSGILYVVSDLVSVWDFIEEFDKEKASFVFDFEACCEELGVESKWLQAGSYVLDKGISGMIKDVIPILFTSHSYGEYQDYYDVLEEMFEQSDTVLKTYEEILDDAKMVSAVGSLFEAEDEGFFEECREKFSKIENVLDFAIFIDTFNQNNEEKLMWMRSVSGNRLNYSYPEAMIHAVFDIEASYSNKWEGGSLKFVQQLTDELIDKLIEKATGEGIAKAVLDILEIGSDLIPDWMEDINNIPYHNAIASSGIGVYTNNYNIGSLSIEEINMQRAHACLFLYASARNWETMADYAMDKGFSEKVEEYTNKANEATDWLGKFIASGKATENDSFRYADGRMKEKYSEELRGIFAKLLTNMNLEQSIISEFQDYYLLDMAVIAEVMSEGGDIHTCELIDVDQDGYKELCMEKYLSDNIHMSQYVFDSWKSPGICIYTDISAAGSTSMLFSESNNKLYLQQDYTTAGFVATTQWEYQNNNWGETSAVSWQQEQGEKLFEEFLKKTEETSTDLQLRTLDNCHDDITHLVVAGNVENICKGLEEFLIQSEREFACTSYDMNADGVEDTVYAIDNYLKKWTDNINFEYAGGGEMFYSTVPNDDILISVCDIGNKVELQIDIDGTVSTSIPMPNNLSVPRLNRYLSIFLTNFLGDYSATNPDYEVLMEFVYTILMYTQSEKVEFENTQDVILKSDVDEILELYFGITSPDMSVGTIEYRDGKFFFPPTGIGQWGFRFAILDEMEEVGHNEYEITFYDVCAFYEDYDSGEINPVAADWNAYYEYNIEQIQEDKFCEIGSRRSCVLKWKDNRFIVLEYKLIDDSAINNAIAEEEVIDYLFQEVPEIQNYAEYISANSNGQATLIAWNNEEVEEYMDVNGITHTGYAIYVGEAWDDHNVNWDWFYIDNESSQIFWINMVEGAILYTLEEWRQSIYYRNL